MNEKKGSDGLQTILATAYDVDPYKGSESGSGWNFVRQISRYNYVIAITRKNNRGNIEKYIDEHGVDSSKIQFEYFDLPKYARFWKRGSRGSSIYFYLWQMFLPLYIKRKGFLFDIAQSVNFHTDSFPSFLWILGKPVVWGPINHNEPIPRQYIPNLEILLKDRGRWIMKNVIWTLDPFLYLAKKKSSMIIGGNSSVKKRLKLRDEKYVCLPTIASTFPEYSTTKVDKSTFSVLIVGRQIGIKSFDIALESFDKFYQKLSEADRENVELRVIGDGPLNGFLRELSQGLSARNSIRFVDWVEQKEMNALYQQASVLLVTSHEGGGAIVAEGLSNGLPILSFKNYGAGEFVNDSCALRIPYGGYEETTSDFADKLELLLHDKKLYSKLSEGAKYTHKNKYTWDVKGDILKEIYEQVRKTLQKIDKTDADIG